MRALQDGGVGWGRKEGTLQEVLSHPARAGGRAGTQTGELTAPAGSQLHLRNPGDPVMTALQAPIRRHPQRHRGQRELRDRARPTDRCNNIPPGVHTLGGGMVNQGHRRIGSVRDQQRTRTVVILRQGALRQHGEHDDGAPRGCLRTPLRWGTVVVVPQAKQVTAGATKAGAVKHVCSGRHVAAFPAEDPQLHRVAPAGRRHWAFAHFAGQSRGGIGVEVLAPPDGPEHGGHWQPILPRVLNRAGYRGALGTGRLLGTGNLVAPGAGKSRGKEHVGYVHYMWGGGVRVKSSGSAGAVSRHPRFKAAVVNLGQPR